MRRNSQKSLREFLAEAENQLSTIITNAQEKLKKIDDNCVNITDKKDAAQSELGAIEQVKTSANSILTELQQYKTQFGQIRAQLDDENDGLSANLEWSKKKKEEIDRIKKESEEQKKNIELLKKKAEELKNEIAEYEKLTTGYKNKIQETYNFMNGQGLAHSFYERKNEIDSAMNFWKWVLIISTMALAGLIVFIFIKPPEFLNLIKDVNSWIGLVSYFSFRLFLFAPLIFSIWYSSSQYSLERKEVSQYAFKGGVAKALENYTDLLTDKFQDKKGEFLVRDKILDFTISCMKDIYENPHHATKEKKMNLEDGKKEIEKFHDLIVKPVSGMVKAIKDSIS